jgi:hypothetical protein
VIVATFLSQEAIRGTRSNLALQIVRQARQHLGRIEYLAGGLRDAADVARNFRGTLRGCRTLRAISRVAAPWSSTAAAAIWLTRWLVVDWIAVTDERVARWIAATWPVISSVAFAVCLARFFSSVATTARPQPASSARAAQ